MTTADAGEPGFEEALLDAVTSLRDAYPDSDLPTESPSLRALAAALDAPNDDYRADVASVLGMLAEQFPAELAVVTPTVAAALDDDTVRKPLLQVLGYVSKENPRAVVEHVSAVTPHLDSENTAVVRNATWTLANVAEAHPENVPDLFPRFADLLSHEEPVQRHAIRALGSAPTGLLTAQPRILDGLLARLASSSLYKTVGRTLVATAPAYGDQLVDELLERIQTGRPAVREHAAWTLVPLADEHPDLVRPHWEALRDLVLTDDDHQVQNSAAAALAALATDRPDEDVVGALVDVQDHADEFVRRYGCLALGDVAVATGNETALRALAAARDDPADVVRRAAEQQLVDAATDYPKAVEAVDPDLVSGDD